MSKSQPKPSPARSQGAITPRRRTRRTLSSASPAQSEGRLSTVVEKFVKDQFVLSPMNRRSVLPDDTEIEAPRRASWWKRLEGSSRDVLEALDTNKMTDELLLEEYEFEVEKDGKPSQSLQQSQSSDNESVASIVVPQRRLFNQKKQTQGKFGDIMGSRKSLGKTNIEDQSIEDAPKNLFNNRPRNRPVFPAALLNSTNKTINKTVEPEVNKPTRPNLFGQAGTKRKNIFTDFVLSDSEEDSEVQHKVFGFKKNNSKRVSLGTRSRRMPSLTPSMTTEIDIDDWNLLPSSTMIGAQEISRMSDKDMEQVQDENQDDTLTEHNASLNPTNKKSIMNDENDETLTNENIEDGNESQNVTKVTDESRKVNERNDKSKTKLNHSGKDKTSQDKSIKRASDLTNVEIDAVVVRQQQNNAQEKGLLAENEPSLEDKMAELHGESKENENQLRVTSNITQEKIFVQVNNTNHPNDGETLKIMEHSAKAQEILNDSKTSNNTRPKESMSGKDNTQNKLEQSAKDHKGIGGNTEEVMANQVEDMVNISKQGKNEKEIETNVDAEVSKHKPEETKQGNEKSLDDKGDLSEKEETEAISEEQEVENQSEEADKSNQDEDMDKSEEEVEPSVDEQESKDQSKEASTNQDENMDVSAEEQESEREQEESEEEQEQSEIEQEQSEEEQEQSEVEQEQSEVEQEQSESEQEQSEVEQEENEEEQEPSIDVQESQNQSDKASKTNQDQDMDVKEKSDDELDQDNQDEHMEEMVWNDNDDEKPSDASDNEMPAEDKQNEVVRNQNNASKNNSKLKQNAGKSENITNKSHKIVDAAVDNDQIEQENDTVEETPNNSTHDTTGRSRKQEVSKVKSPEAVLQNMTNDNESFRPIGRSTTFRKSKSVYETMNMKHSLAPVHESTLGSEGSRNSTTEGSEWDSHRTTRKTIRQTLGKEYTTRKSLRALVMEQSAKRQTEHYNKSAKFDKTKNKTVTEDGNDKNSSKINKTKNITVVEDDIKNASKVNKTTNKTVTEEGNKNVSAINKTKNKTIIEDANNDNASIVNKTKNKTVLEDINDQHIRFRRTSNRNISSNPSPNLKSSVHETSTHHVPDPLISEYQASYHKSQYDIKEPEIFEICNPEDSVNIPIPDNNDSGPEISMNASYGQGMSASGHEVSAETSHIEMSEKENTSPKVEDISRRNTFRSKSLHNSDQEILDYEASEQVISGLEDQENSENDEFAQESVQDENLESENEVESENEEQSELEVESEEENEKSQQEIEDSEHEDNEEESQEIEQEIESDQESEPEEQSDHDISQEVSTNDDREPDENYDKNDSISALNYTTPEKRSGVSRVVFDSNMMSGDEIDFEGVSRQTANDTNVTEQSEELSRASVHRVSEQSERVHDVSVGTKKSMLLMQMQKIAQQNMERRQKIRDNVQKSLKPTSDFNVGDIGLKLPKYSIRRPQTEPRKPKIKPRPTIASETLPRAFTEDLMYKPPKRFQPASAPWITKRLYKFLETKLEPKYDYRARSRAEDLVQSIFSFTKLVRRRDLAPAQAVHELKREMARLRVVTTHYEFYDFFHEFMPREIRIKVNPDVVNKIPMPENGVFSDILQARAVSE